MKALIYNSIIDAKEVNKHKAVAEGCTGSLTSYWWELKELTDGTFALLINDMELGETYPEVLVELKENTNIPDEETGYINPSVLIIEHTIPENTVVELSEEKIPAPPEQ